MEKRDSAKYDFEKQFWTLARVSKTILLTSNKKGLQPAFSPFFLFQKWLEYFEMQSA